MWVTKPLSCRRSICPKAVATVARAVSTEIQPDCDGVDQCARAIPTLIVYARLYRTARIKPNGSVAYIYTIVPVHYRES